MAGLDLNLRHGQKYQKISNLGERPAVDGVRAQFEPVARYFRRAGLDKLLELPGFGAAA